MKTLLISCLSFLLTLCLHADTSGATWEDFTHEQVVKHLETNLSSEQIVVRVNGLVCESCAIVLRKKVSKLDAVDTKKLKKGLSMDVYKMLLYVALKEGKSPAPAELRKAIEDAGYEGTLILYQEQNGKITSQNL